ncbi:MAG: hypothetical protein EHM46_02430 [Bacteroidetes bacterium]|nr:MAG: hypothetical protein EHM46_02430 [Bacteroidota bacterium]
MKRLATIALVVMLSIPLVHAQESMFNMGDKVVNLGIGLGSTLYRGLYYSRGVPPVSISYEQALMDEILEKGVIGVGGYLGYTSYKYRYDWLGGEYGWNYSNIILAALGSFHYPLVDKLDTYGGVLVGYRINTAREYGDIPTGTINSASGGIVFSPFVGARYYFTDNIAAFGQLGYGIAYLTLGVSLRMN